jgi:hypothetical protein
MDEQDDLRKGIRKPKLVGPHPFSFEELMRDTWPASDEETERFVQMITKIAVAQRRSHSGI